MISNKLENLLWVERYRPKTIAECALPRRLVSAFGDILAGTTMPNMTFAGPAGCGKTTAALALMNQMGMDTLLINASENGNIDTIRSTVRNFGSGMSFEGKMRGIILDEGDYLTPLAQASLRGMMEELSQNCRFVITANFGNKIIDPLLSRAPVVDFTYNTDEKLEAIVAADQRLRQILQVEGVGIPERADDAFTAFLMKNFPDLRRAINVLQRSCRDGAIDWAALEDAADLNDYDGLIAAMRSASFPSIRKWVAEQVDRDGASIRRHIFNLLDEVVKPHSMPAVILILAEYDYKESFVVDREINTLAMLLNIMTDAEFK